MLRFGTSLATFGSEARRLKDSKSPRWASLWPTPNVTVVEGIDRLGIYKKTEASHRQFCTSCGAPVLIRHPDLGLTDVPAGSIQGLVYEPTVHVHYGEKVLAVRDGLPKFKDFPKDFGGSGEMVPE